MKHLNYLWIAVLLTACTEPGIVPTLDTQLLLDIPCDPQALYDALDQANTNGERDALTLAHGCRYILQGRRLEMLDMMVSGNGATLDGDGRSEVLFSSALELSDVTITGAAGGSAVEIFTDTILTNVTVQDNDAVGIRNYDDLELNQSAVIANVGTGIVNLDHLHIRKSTVANNVGARAGGILTVPQSVLRLYNTTVFGNGVQSPGARAGNIFNDDGFFELVNSVVAGAVNGPNCSSGDRAGTFADQHTLSSDGTCGDALQVEDMKLDPVTNSDGFIAYYVPQAMSPVLMAADPERCPALDQLGSARPQPAGTACDSGAIEVDQVLDPSEALLSLIADIGMVDLPAQVTQPLVTLLTQAERSYAKDNRQAALGQLGAVMRQLEASRGRTMEVGVADELTERVQLISSVIEQHLRGGE